MAAPFDPYIVWQIQRSRVAIKVAEKDAACDAWRGCSGTLELAASRGGWHSFQMQGLGFRVANDRHHLDLHHVGLFLDGKLPLDYIRHYGFELDESRTIEIHRNLSLFP